MNAIISSKKKTLIKNITTNIDTRYAGSLATVLISKKEGSLTLITGQSPLYSHCTFILDKSSTYLKDAQFSIDGSFAKQIPHYFESNQDIELIFHTSSSSHYSIELIHKNTKSNEDALRRCECVDACEEHLTYFKENEQRPTSIVSKSVIERVIHESGQHIPFKFLEMNKDKQHIRLQRDDDVEEVHLPGDLKLPTSMVLTPEITHQLGDLCKATDGDELEIAQQGELLILKAPESSITCSLAGVEEFFAKKPIKFSSVKHAVLDFYAFKAEVRHCFTEYGTIKKADDALLYLSDTKASIAVLTEPYEFVHPITVIETYSKTKNTESLYRFSPKELLSISISDLTKAYSTRLDILEYENGQLKLAVYYSLENKLPHRSIPIEKDESQLPKVLAMLESLDKSKNNTQHKKQEVQDDLFGFDMDENEEY
jgi:hypothetical protein